MIVITVALFVAIYFTMNYAKSNSYAGNNMQMPEMNGNQVTPGGEPPTKPEDTNSTNTVKPGESSDSNDVATRPARPDDESSNDNTPSDMPEPKGFSTETKTIETMYYFIFVAECLLISLLIMYLVMSKFNKKTFTETLSSSDKKIIYILATIVLTSILSLATIYITNNYLTTGSTSGIPSNGSNTETNATGNITVEGTDESLSGNYESNTADESVILIKNSGILTLNNAIITKTSGDSNNTENSEFYGINAGILVTANSTATIKNTTISTNAKGSNAVFSTGENSKIYLNNTKIATTGSSSSRGLDATYGGYIEADNVDIKTEGGSCATLATDRGEGTVTVKNSKLETNGSGSPLIYSTGDISINNTTGNSNGSQLVVIEGKNSATITNSTINAAGTGNRGDTDQAGVMIYQSMSGDADTGTGTLTTTNSTLTILPTSTNYKTAPMFFITNTNATINLTNTKLVYGSNILISAKGTTEWGTTGSNGGEVTLNAKKQTLTGNIEIDNISTLSLNLVSSTYKGTINKDNTAKSISLTLDKDSTITLTGNSYITTLNDTDTSYSNINFNGYKLYVNNKAIN